MYKVVWTKEEYDWRERNNKEVRLFKDKIVDFLNRNFKYYTVLFFMSKFLTRVK